MKKLVFSSVLFWLAASFASSLHSQSTYKLAEQDSLALVAFYWATDGPNWTSNREGFGFDDLTSEWQVTYNGNFNNWFDGPVKDWFGVRVEKLPIANSMDSIDRVTWLWPVIGRRTDGQNLLDGYVPREIGLLTELKQFRVNGNDGFREELIPDEIYHESLEHFDTESAWFGAGLSDALRNCINLRKLNVRYNLYDYMPNLDFLDEEGLRNLDGTQWFYNSRFSYFYMERIVDYFYSISDVPMEFGFEARDMFDVGDEIEIVAPVGSAVEMVCNDAGSQEEFITYQWFKDGLSKFGKTKRIYDFSSISASDYGHYTTRITNDYVKNYDTNGNYGEVFTKGVHLVETPATPVIRKSVVENSGQVIDLYFSKTMTGAEGFASLEIKAEDRTIAVSKAEVTGRLDRQVRLYLESPVSIGELVTLSYSGDQIKDQNGGSLEVIDGLELENRARRAPEVVSASTTLDGSGIVLEFDYYIDESSLENAVFTVEGNAVYEVSALRLQPGPVNQKISKSVLIGLQESISDSAEVIIVSYDSGNIHGLYGGSVNSFEGQAAENIVTVDRTEVTLLFEDGTNEFESIAILGSWKLDPVEMSDDGSKGDATAGDHVWTLKTALPDDTYTWDAYARRTVTRIDTIESTDENGNIVLTLMESQEDIDSLLSGGFILEFSIGDREVTGDTVFGIQNRDVVFNLRVDAGGEDIFLMGIDDNWNDGILMEKVTDDTYTYTLPKKTAGDILNYNYRKGLSFENQTPETRIYSVINDYNEVNDEFGIFTNIEEVLESSFEVFPNPSKDGIVTIKNLGNVGHLKVYNTLGILISTIETDKPQPVKVDLSQNPPGLYYFQGSNSSGDKIIKTYKVLIY